jgi:hypothetical protein
MTLGLAVEAPTRDRSRVILQMKYSDLASLSSDHTELPKGRGLW